jgi:hypothetical protein
VPAGAEKAKQHAMDRGQAAIRRVDLGVYTADIPQGLRLSRMHREKLGVKIPDYCVAPRPMKPPYAGPMTPRRRLPGRRVSSVQSRAAPADVMSRRSEDGLATSRRRGP